MFLFKRSGSKYVDFSAIGIDMHSHLIPGVDDGAENVNDSLALITGLKALGFRHLFTTPHTYQDVYPNTRESLTAAYNLLAGRLPDGIGLHLSSEYYLDTQLSALIAEGTVMPLPGNRLLVEFSQIAFPKKLEEMIFDLSIKGYQVVLAHPERYLFFHKEFDYFRRLKDMDIEFQVNALSLTQHYGERIRSVAEKLIRKEYIDFIGTDVHHIGHLNALKKVPLTKSFGTLINSNLLKNHTLVEN